MIDLSWLEAGSIERPGTSVRRLQPGRTVLWRWRRGRLARQVTIDGLNFERNWTLFSMTSRRI
jgi:hypothetical protein